MLIKINWLRALQEKSLELSNAAARIGISKSRFERDILEAEKQHIKDYGVRIGSADVWQKRLNLSRDVAEMIFDITKPLEGVGAWIHQRKEDMIRYYKPPK